MQTQQIKIIDQSINGQPIGELVVELPREQVTVREILRGRIFQAVKDFNLRCERVQDNRQTFELTEHEKRLNGPQTSQGSMVDWQENFRLACKRFAENQILVFIDGCQMESLDQGVLVDSRTDIKFMYLTMLAGG